MVDFARRGNGVPRKRTFIIADRAVMFWQDKDDKEIWHCETLLRFTECPPGLAYALGGGMTGHGKHQGQADPLVPLQGYFWHIRCSIGSEIGQWWVKKGWIG